MMKEMREGKVLRVLPSGLFIRPLHCKSIFGFENIMLASEGIVRDKDER
jgi:hypothetical protein